MEQQVQQEIQSKLEQQWDRLFPAILQQFTTVSQADLESASSVGDIVTRIADRTRYSERYVENRLHELVSSGGQVQRPFAGRRNSS